MGNTEMTGSESHSIHEENKRIRLLRITTDLTIQLISSGHISMNEAIVLINRIRQFAVKLFPGKEKTFDLIYAPRFRRAMVEAGLGDARAFLVALDGGLNHTKGLCDKNHGNTLE